MRPRRSAILYIAAGLGAIAVVAFLLSRDAVPTVPVAADYSTLEAMRTGDMKKLVFHTVPKLTSTDAFEAEDGSLVTLEQYRGKYILLNFWATWCAPCRREMPMLSDLQSRLGGEDFAVVTLATGRNPRPAVQKFFEEIGVDNLPLNRDPTQKIAREMGVFGLPMTMILNPEGLEIARLTGDAEWNSESALAILTALTGGS